MFKKNTAVTGFGIGHFINASSGAAVVEGTPTCKRTIDGTGAACANEAQYNTNGAVWEIDLAAGDMNGDVIILSFTLTDCLPIAYTIKTVTGVPDASGYYPADAVAISGDTTAANNLESYCDGTTPQPVNVMYWYSGAVPEPSQTGVPEVDVTFVGGSAASGVATIDANVIEWKGDTAPAMTGDAYAAVGTLSTTIGTPAGADLATDVAAIKTETALIVADTGELQTDWVNGGRLDLIVDAILEDTATTIPGTLTTISGYVDCLPATWVTVPTVAAISDAVWDEAATGHTDAGKAGAQLWTDIDAILEDTATTIPGTLTTISGYVDCLPATLDGSTFTSLPNVTVGTNSDKTGYYMYSEQVFNLTGSITGSLSGSVGSVTGNVGGNVAGSVGSVTATVNADVLSIDGTAVAGPDDLKADVSTLATAAELAKVPKSDSTVSWNATALAAINTQCDTAITDAALATAAAVTTVDTVVDAIKLVTDKLDTLVEEVS